AARQHGDWGGLGIFAVVAHLKMANRHLKYLSRHFFEISGCLCICWHQLFCSWDGATASGLKISPVGAVKATPSSLIKSCSSFNERATSRKSLPVRRRTTSLRVSNPAATAPTSALRSLFGSHHGTPSGTQSHLRLSSGKLRGSLSRPS